MDYLAYSEMVDANQETATEPELNFPKIKFNFSKVFKSAFLTLATVGMVLASLPQAQAAVSAINFVRTSGSCLNIRSRPRTNAPIVGCLRNGSRIAVVAQARNGFSRLASGNFVATRYIGARPTRGYTPGRGVGGPVTLSLGSEGASVTQVQRALGIAPTGFYGTSTARAVRNFQANYGLLVDGTVGPQTRVALGF